MPFNLRLLNFFSLGFILFLVVSCARPGTIESAMLEDKSSFYYINVNEYPKDRRSFTYEYKYGHMANNIQEYIKWVPFSRNSIPVDILERLSMQVPSVYELILSFNNENPKTDYLKQEEKIKHKDEKK